MWEEFPQEDAWIVAQEENMVNEDQSLTTHIKKIKRDHHHIKKGKNSDQNKKYNPGISSRDLSKFICYTCDEKGHFARDCTINKCVSHKNKENKRRHHAHTT